MSDFETADELKTFFAEHGDAITLLPGDPGEVEISVLWEESHRQDNMVDGTGPGFTAIQSELSPVQYGSTIRKDEVDYTIRNIKPDGTGLAHVTLSRD